MITHPAYLEQSTRQSIQALVTSVFQASAQAQSLLLTVDRGTCRAWLRHGVIPIPVTTGQVWNFLGDFEDFGDFGEQFDIKEAALAIPDESLLIAVLRFHVPALSGASARRIEQRLGTKGLMAAIKSGDTGLLANAHGGPAAIQIAKSVVTAWNELLWFVCLAREFYEYGLSEQLLRTVVAHYREHSLSQLQADPYRLLAFTEFDTVDRIAREKFSISRYDPKRLMAIVDAAVYSLYDVGKGLVTREQLACHMQAIAKLDEEMTRIAIELAVLHKRLVVMDSELAMGEGFAKIESLVTHFLHAQQCTKEHVHSEPLSLSVTDIGYVASEVALYSRPVVVIRNESVTSSFIKTLAVLLNKHGEQCNVLAGTKALAERIQAGTGVRTVSVSEALASGMYSPLWPSATRNRRRVILVSSIVDLPTAARIFRQLHKNDWVCFVGKPLEEAGDRMLLLPALLDAGSEFCVEILGEIETGVARAEFLNFDMHIPAYSPSDSMRTGVFWVHVDEALFDQAIIGVSYQLSQHGSVAIVARELAQRTHCIKLLEVSASSTGDHIRTHMHIVVAADDIEPGDSDSTVVVLRSPTSQSIGWLKAAINTSKHRTIVVSTVASATELLSSQREVVTPA